MYADLSTFAPPPFALQVQQFGTTATVTVSGEVDVATADRVRRAVLAALRQRPEIVVVDLEHTTFIDSTGITALVAAHRAALAVDVPLKVVATPATRTLFGLCGLGDVLAAVEGHRDGRPFVDGRRGALS